MWFKSQNIDVSELQRAIKSLEIRIVQVETANAAILAQQKVLRDGYLRRFRVVPETETEKYISSNPYMS